VIIRFAGFGGQGIVPILRVIACYDRKITGAYQYPVVASLPIPQCGAVTRMPEETKA
jgi:hypothetical protein